MIRPSQVYTFSILQAKNSPSFLFNHFEGSLPVLPKDTSFGLLGTKSGFFEYQVSNCYVLCLILEFEALETLSLNAFLLGLARSLLSSRRSKLVLNPTSFDSRPKTCVQSDGWLTSTEISALVRKLVNMVFLQLLSLGWSDISKVYTIILLATSL